MLLSKLHAIFKKGTSKLANVSMWVYIVRRLFYQLKSLSPVFLHVLLPTFTFKHDLLFSVLPL